MMKILQISPEAPGKKSGGALAVYQTVASVKEIQDVQIDYIGPEIYDNDIRALYTVVHELHASKNILLRAFNLIFHKITNARYEAWKHLRIDFNTYDRIILEFTKLDYILERVNADKLIVHVHNIESDFARCDYQSDKTLEKKILAELAEKHEKRLTANAHRLVTLTENDKDKVSRLYNVDENKIDVIPICLTKRKEAVTVESNKEINILITGSLWFGENANGVIWFINKVLPLLKVEYKLTIAGAMPSEEIKTLVSSNRNIKLVDTPEFMEPYFENADIVACPIFNGAGMKVKVGEALSYGKPVIATSHALIGYRINPGINSYEANKPEEFADGINEFGSMDAIERQKISQEALNLFNNNYSMNISTSLWEKELKK